MSKAPMPPDESARIAELESFRILDTSAEQSYDDITRLAAQICDTPIAKVSFVDTDRQRFKSRVGLKPTETTREIAFCAHAVMDSDEMLIVPDATADARFADNELVVSDPMIRFYAGAPLATESGHAIGTLCVMDHKPRSLTEQQRQALEALARQVMVQLSLRQALDHGNQQQIELAKAIRQRETLVAAISHELRTPLTAVLGYIDVLRETEGQIADDERKEFLTTAAGQAEELSHIIDDLLVAARLEQKTLKITRVPVNLQAQVAQVVEGLETPESHTIEVQATPVRAWGDPGRVRQIVRNLITNAVRYGGSDIGIHTYSNGRTAHIRVLDNGDPIPGGDIDTIFSPYSVSSSRNVAAGSIGLGLAISRQLANLMDGDITYRHDDANSIFDLELPAHA
ncbi:MAG: GAF domain-containing sensor histidine kinase [Acidimicrobiia bacterium]|nr:GAF domain-containing sensor histidine kinase [Acidimicrobiia bacterium]MDX2468608.1 GAF domain-containing sensor histidine kinase [Acidimicrobiia bacterium]